MTSFQAAVPSAASRLALFRSGRLDDGVKDIARTAQAFREEVGVSLTGTRSKKDSLRALSKAFVASYHAFSESLEAARSGDVVQGATVDVLEGIMRKMKSEYASGLQSMRQDVGRLDPAGPVFKEFGAAVSDKIDRLEKFWQTTYQHAPKHRM